MLPFENRPWAKPLAAIIIVFTLLAAFIAPIVLHEMKELDPPMILAILLLLLAIVPPNIVVLRRKPQAMETNLRGSVVLASRAVR